MSAFMILCALLALITVKHWLPTVVGFVTGVFILLGSFLAAVGVGLVAAVVGILAGVVALIRGLKNVTYGRIIGARRRAQLLKRNRG